ncbi:hypothetical protein PLICRDRAFT_95724 [Plicaturopsis crispa FD-325 SS-3]|uniref:J domain-containing protein n=1 Tax=Plicaturopsis crispa FD-325 SS-3 TaxID=944288 RepID=A0A0C9SWJ0_PLICR|nr:hypothetical protein PLICRDRAFT_95724 [Plicaturopsis crispa FD-325 SS-3]
MSFSFSTRLAAVDRLAQTAGPHICRRYASRKRKQIKIDMSTYYTTLGVTPESELHEIESKYFELAKQLHVDHNQDKRARVQFDAVVKAATVLRDPEQRKLYNHRLRERRDDAILRAFKKSGPPPPKVNPELQFIRAQMRANAEERKKPGSKPKKKVPGEPDLGSTIRRVLGLGRRRVRLEAESHSAQTSTFQTKFPTAQKKTATDLKYEAMRKEVLRREALERASAVARIEKMIKEEKARREKEEAEKTAAAVAEAEAKVKWEKDQAARAAELEQLARQEQALKQALGILEKEREEMRRAKRKKAVRWLSGLVVSGTILYTGWTSEPSDTDGP